jgi:hypothetical protein
LPANEPESNLRRLERGQMANWSNVQLVIAGRSASVLRFSRLARVRPSSLFQPDMRQGEGGNLTSTRVAKLGSNLLKKAYSFQVRNDDGLQHFRRVSRRYPKLCFVLSYGDPNADDYGSYFILRGRARSYKLSDRLKEAVMARHGVTGDAEDDDDEWRFWDASSDLVDLAEAHWQKSMLKAIVQRK